MQAGRIMLAPVVASVLLMGGCGSKASETASGPVGDSAAAASAPGASATVAPGTSGGVQCPASTTIKFAKSKFVLHAGLTFGAFHRYLYKPYKSGSFGNGGLVHKAAIIAKAGAAAVFIKHELGLVAQDVAADPALCNKLAKPLSDFGQRIGSLSTGIKHGDTTGMDAAQNSLSTAESTSAGAGVAVKEDDNPKI